MFIIDVQVAVGVLCCASDTQSIDTDHETQEAGEGGNGPFPLRTPVVRIAGGLVPYRGSPRCFDFKIFTNWIPLRPCDSHDEMEFCTKKQAREPKRLKDIAKQDREVL